MQQMKPEDIKAKWIDGTFLRKWRRYDIKQIENTGLHDHTIEFLKCGFMISAAPFIDFNEYNGGERFTNIVDYYSKYDLHLEPEKKRFIVFGSDSVGNAICIDTKDDDSIVLLDHEMEFIKIMNINKNILEFAMCILIYNDFVTKIQKKYGDEAFLDGKFDNIDIVALINEFNTYNEDMLKESDFWAMEVNALKEEIKN
jgi:hypothetical protein